MSHPRLNSLIPANLYRSSLIGLLINGDAKRDLKFDDLQPSSKEVLYNLASKLESLPSADVGAIHKEFMKTFLLDAYIPERKKGTFGTKKGELMTYIEAVSKVYKELNSQPLFVSKLASTIKEGREDAELLNGVTGNLAAKDEAEFLTKETFKAALRYLNENKFEEFGNCFRAVSRMDTIRHWDALVTSQQQQDPRFEELRISHNNKYGNSVDTSFLKKLYEALTISNRPLTYTEPAVASPSPAPVKIHIAPDALMAPPPLLSLFNKGANSAAPASELPGSEKNQTPSPNNKR